MLVLGLLALTQSSPLSSGLQGLALRAGFPLGSVEEKHCWDTGGAKGKGEARGFLSLALFLAASLPQLQPLLQRFSVVLASAQVPRF